MKVSKSVQDKIIGGAIALFFSIIYLFAKNYFSKEPAGVSQGENHKTILNDSSTQKIIEQKQTNNNSGNVTNEFIQGDKNVTTPMPSRANTFKPEGNAKKNSKSGDGDNIKIESKNNSGVIVGKMGNGNVINPLPPERKLTEQEKDRLIRDLNKKFNENKMDFRDGCVYVIVPQNNNNPESPQLASDISVFLKSQGYHVENPAISLVIAGLTTHIKIDYDKLQRCIRIVVLIP